MITPSPYRRAFSTRFVQRSLERIPVAAHADGLTLELEVSALQATGELVEPDHLVRRHGRPGLLARKRQKVVCQPCKPVCVVLQVGDQLGVRAVLGEIGDVADQRGQRRPELMRGVGQEPSLTFARPLERSEHPVQRRCQPADLVVALRLRQPPPWVARLLDLRRRARQPAEWRQRTPHQKRQRERRHGRGDQRRDQHEQADAGQRLLERRASRPRPQPRLRPRHHPNPRAGRR